MIGGRGLKPVEEFNPTSKKWIKHGTTPIEMHHITPLSFKGKIHIVTGLTGPYPTETPLKYVYEYSPSNDEWSKVFEIPKARQRGGAGVVLHNDKIYIVGGIKNGHTSDTTNYFDEYDPVNKTWKVLKSAPHIRDHSNAVILSGKLIAFGGRNSSYHEPEKFTAFMSQVNNKLDVYNFESNSWYTLSSRLPFPTGGGGAVTINNTLYYTGGETGALPANNQMASFSFETNTWKVQSPLRQGRHGTNLVNIGSVLYIAAGSGQRGGSPELSSIESFDTELRKE